MFTKKELKNHIRENTRYLQKKDVYCFLIKNYATYYYNYRTLLSLFDKVEYKYFDLTKFIDELHYNISLEKNINYFLDNFIINNYYDYFSGESSERIE